MLSARLLLPFVAVAAAGLPVETVTLKGRHKKCTYRIDYPRTGQARIDEALAAYAKGFSGACDHPPVLPGDGYSGAAESWKSTPTVVRNDDQVFAVSFEEEIDSPNVHDTHERTTFNFLRPDGWRIYLPEIFEPAGLRKISQLAIAALEKELGTSDEMNRMIAGGAGPDWDNFEVFVLRPKTLDIYFASERVGDYASGPQQIELPLAEVGAYYRKDWRAPAPSFDCGKATTAVERAICGDVALARRDRALHATYTVKLRYAKPDQSKELRQTQHAWLQRRDATCGAKPPADLVACLDALYRERLTALGARR